MSKKISARVSVLHLTHTDLRFDSRIRREILSLLDFENISIYALGIKQDPIGLEEYAFDQFNYKNVKLFLSFLRKYKSIFYIFFNIELIVKFFFQGLRFKPSIVHCHDTMVLPVGLLFKFIFKSKLIYDAHELESKKTAQSEFLSIVTLLIEKISWNKVDILISVSNSILNWYQKNLGSKKSLLILNTPSNNKSINSKFDKGYLRRIYNINEKQKVFLYLGDLTVGRNIENILKIFTELSNDYHIIFVGFGRLKPIIIDASQVYKNIHYHPPVAEHEITRISRGANYGLCFIENISLSYYYSLANKFFEYSFSGLQVLCSNFPEYIYYTSIYNIGKTFEPTFDGIKKAILNCQLPEKNILLEDLHDVSWESQSLLLRTTYKELIENC